MTNEMEGGRRNDKKLISLSCPHCKQVVPAIQVDCFEKQQLIYMKCPNCDEGITKPQIDDAYRLSKQTL